MTPAVAMVIEPLVAPGLVSVEFPIKETPIPEKPTVLFSVKFPAISKFAAGRVN